MIEAVVFDFDGLIFDSETPEYQSWAAIFTSFGVELTVEKWTIWLGIGMHDSQFSPYDYLEECLGAPVDRDRIRVERQEKYESLTKDADVRPGVRQYLATAKQLGLKIAVASSGRRNWVVPHLEKYQLSHFFDTVCVRDDVTHGKPNPEVYLKALNNLDVKANHAIAFEDSPVGASAATAAGMRCVIVPNPLTEQLHFKQYDLRLTSMLQMDLATVIQQLTDSQMEAK